MTLLPRLAQKCGNLVGDIGEEELYVEYRKSKDLLNYLCKEYTKDCVKKAKQELWYGKYSNVVQFSICGYILKSIS